MKRLYIFLAVIAVIAWLGIGIVVAKGPQPEIVVPAEVLTKVGPLNITNTMLTAWFVMIVLIGLAFLATRSMRLMPQGIQNFFEAAIGFLLDQMEQIAGEKNARRFFPVVATIFFFVLASNWMGLLPFFNAIGKTDDVGHEIFQEIHENNEKHQNFVDSEDFGMWEMEESGGIVVAKSGTKHTTFAIAKDETPGVALDRYIVFLAKRFAGFTPSNENEAAAPSKAEVEAARAALKSHDKTPVLLEAPPEGEHEEGVASASGTGTVYGVDFSNSKKLALIIPFFRSAFSDVNNTLALGIVAFFMIEFWGFQSLGFSYIGKFLNFKGGVIGFFVGGLEALSEFIRIISFAFRLFGNIFAGEVLVLMLTFLMPFLVVDIIYGLELFVGFIQAAVFALLTLVFGAMAVEHHGEGEHDGHGHDDAAHAEHGAAQAH